MEKEPIPCALISTKGIESNIAPDDPAELVKDAVLKARPYATMPLDDEPIPSVGGAGFEIVEKPATPITDAQMWANEPLDKPE